MDVLVALQPAQLLHANAPRPADAAQIVPQEIDDHDVFGPILLAAAKFVGRPAVLCRVDGSRPGALDRPRLDGAGGHLQEPLGRGADDLEIAQVEIPGKRRRIAPPQPPVQRHRVVPRRAQQPLGEIHLKDVAGVDVLDRPADRAEVVGVREIARQVRPAFVMSATGYCRTNSPAGQCRPARATLGGIALHDRARTASRRPPAGVLPPGGVAFPVRPRAALRDDPAASPDVVERGHDVVESDRPWRAGRNRRPRASGNTSSCRPKSYAHRPAAPP